MPLYTILGSRYCCIVNDGLLTLLERCKGLRCLLKDLGFGIGSCAHLELISPMPNCPHHHSHEVHVFSSFMNQLDQVCDAWCTKLASVLKSWSTIPYFVQCGGIPKSMGSCFGLHSTMFTPVLIQNFPSHQIVLSWNGFFANPPHEVSHFIRNIDPPNQIPHLILLLRITCKNKNRV